MESEFDRPRCPECKRFVADARATVTGERLSSVTGQCKTHGLVTLGSSWWDYDLWFAEDAS
jgi:hypothetical protein